MSEEVVISIVGLNKAAVLCELYNAAHPLGLGFLHYDPTPMTVEEAQTLLDSGQDYFDYYKGRVMKVSLKSDTLSPWAYDRDNGPGAAKRAISRCMEHTEATARRDSRPGGG